MQTAQPLIHEDFLLHTPAARRLYHEYAEPMPVVDTTVTSIPARSPATGALTI